MNNQSVSIFIFSALAQVGAVLLIAGLLIWYMGKRKIHSCSQKGMGKVIKYSFANNTPSPIVEYEVNGMEYHKKRTFRGVVSTEVFSPFGSGEEEGKITIDESDVVHIRKGVVLDLQGIAEELYPLGSELPVFYNPQNPRQAYVERVPEKPPVTWLVCFWTGLGIVALGVLMGLVLR